MIRLKVYRILYVTTICILAVIFLFPPLFWENIFGSDDKAIDMCYTVAESLNLYGFKRGRDECNLEILADSGEKDIMVIMSPMWQKPLPDCKFPPNIRLFDFQIDKSTGEFIYINNSYISIILSEDRHPAQLKLTETDVAQKAKKYLDIINPNQKNLSEPYIRKYEFASSTAKKWSAVFYRTYEEYRFSEDFINIEFTEKHGLAAYYRNFHSNPPSSVEIKITKDNAIKQANKECPKILKIINENYLYSGSEVLEAEIVIINPKNRMASEKHKKMKKEDTVLVYAVQLRMKYASRNPRNKKQGEEPVVIYIDAASGEYVCADLFM